MLTLATAAAAAAPASVRSFIPGYVRNNRAIIVLWASIKMHQARVISMAATNKAFKEDCELDIICLQKDTAK